MKDFFGSYVNQAKTQTGSIPDCKVAKKITTMNVRLLPIAFGDSFTVCYTQAAVLDDKYEVIGWEKIDNWVYCICQDGKKRDIYLGGTFQLSYTQTRPRGLINPSAAFCLRISEEKWIKHFVVAREGEKTEMQARRLAEGEISRFFVDSSNTQELNLVEQTEHDFRTWLSVHADKAKKALSQCQ